MGRPSFFKAVFLVLLKDFREYYGKAPTISWGLLFPVALVVLLGYYSKAYGPWRTIPGLVTISLLFSSTTMPQVSVGFDKLSGGLQLFTYSPITVGSIFVGKTLGGLLFGLAGSLVAVLTLFLLGVAVPFTHMMWLLLGLILGGIVFSLIAMAIAFVYPATQAVALLNIIRFTMVFLGGLLFPKIVMPSFLLPIVYAFPAVYVNEIVRFGSFNTYDYVDPYTSVVALFLFILFVAMSSYLIVRRSLYH
jgi:ABC-2 type transport system permease protein